MSKQPSPEIAAWLKVGAAACGEPPDTAKLVAHVLRMFAQGMPLAPALVVSQSEEVIAAGALACKIADALELLVTPAPPKEPAKARASVAKKSAARELAEARATLRIRKLTKARR